MPPSSPSKHIPILLDPIVDAVVSVFLNAKADGQLKWFVDCTFGGGGHTRAILDKLRESSGLENVRFLGVDRDLVALERAKVNFEKEVASGLLELRHSRMSELGAWVRENGVYAVLADFGFSSDQIEDAGRGLSFLKDGPLDMRLDSSQGASCFDLLQDASESELQKWLMEFGEERYFKRIAGAIVEKRQLGQVPKTTAELVSLVVKALPSHARHGRIHCATRTFQALRMAVNDEMGEVQGFLDGVCHAVQPGGKIAVLSFHSLEDRLVKRCFKEDPGFRPLLKKPMVAPPEEVSANPRARSAKLRIAERL